MTLALALSLALGTVAAPSPAFTARVDARLKAALARVSAPIHADAPHAVHREGRTPRPAGR